MKARLYFFLLTIFFFSITFSTSTLGFCYDAFAPAYAPTHFSLSHESLMLQLKGRVKLALHDLEGQGGARYDSVTDTQTIGTRSAFIDLDTFELALRLEIESLLDINSVVSFDTEHAYLSSIFIQHSDKIWGPLSHYIELGYHSSPAAVHVHTLRKPLIAKALWEASEYHLVYRFNYQFFEHSFLSIVGSLSLLPPLGLEPIHESHVYRGTYSILSHSHAEPYSGNSVAGLGGISLLSYGFYAAFFGSFGEMSTRRGIEVLASVFPNYRQLDGYVQQDTEASSWWLLGRLGYEGYGVHVTIESAYAVEALIKRYGLYAEASYRYELFAPSDFPWFWSFETLVRYEMLHFFEANKINKSGVALRGPEVINAPSWDYDILTLHQRIWIYRDIIAMGIEYSFIWEDNGVKALGIDTQSIKNNELELELRIQF